MSQGNYDWEGECIALRARLKNTDKAYETNRKMAEDLVQEKLSWKRTFDAQDQEIIRLKSEWQDLLNQRGALEDFLKNEISEALTDLLNYIDNAGWTRGQQAEHDSCVETMTKLNKLCGLI